MGFHRNRGGGRRLVGGWGLGTPDLFVNDQVAARLDGISLAGLTILSGPAEQPAGAEGQLPGFGSAQV